MTKQADDAAPSLVWINDHIHIVINHHMEQKLDTMDHIQSTKCSQIYNNPLWKYVTKKTNAILSETRPCVTKC